jgi:LacI family transcriptional regulator
VDGTRQGKGAPVTIIDVARAAGVSRATASRALAGYGRISAATREKVRSAAEQIGYQPNDLARAVRAGRSFTIGLVVTDIANPFFAQAAKSVVSTASAQGYQVLIADTDEDPEAERRAVGVFAEKRVGGLIVVPSAAESYDHLFRHGRPRLPLVLLDRRLPGDRAAAVVTDDFGAASEAVALLAGKGHRRIGMIDGNSTVPGFTTARPRLLVSAAADRIDGFRSGMRQAGLRVRQNWMLYAQAADPAAARGAALALLGGKERPTAVVTNNSDVALGVLAVCRELGLSLGGEVSLVTFDDADWTRACTPEVSIVSRPVPQLGKAAARELIAQIGGQPPSGPVVLPNTVLDRASVADLRPAPASARR